MFLKQWVYQALSPPLRSWAVRGGHTVGLCYHRFTPEAGEDPVAGMSISPDQFRMHLHTLAAMGSFISLDQALEPSPGSGLRFFLTFDDGYRDNSTVLLPILEEYDIPVCIYLVGGAATGDIKQLSHDQQAGYSPPLLSGGDIQELGNHPLVTLGSHTMHHHRLSSLSRDEAQSEIRAGQVALQEILGAAPRHFAVPYGGRADARWEETLELAAQEGLVSVASNFGGANRVAARSAEGVRHLKRVSMGPIAEPWNVRGWVMTRAFLGGLRPPVRS